MKTKLWAMALVILCTLFTTAGQYFWKLGADNIELTFSGMIINYWLLLGFVFYGISVVILVFAFKGGELSVLYPLIATSFIWVTIISSIALKEVITANKWLGVFTIIVGISFIGVGSR